MPREPAGSNVSEPNLAQAVELVDVSMHNDALHLLWEPDYQVPIAPKAVHQVAAIDDPAHLIQGGFFVQGETAFIVLTGTHTLGAVLATIDSTQLAWNRYGGRVQAGVLRPFQNWVVGGGPEFLLEQATREGASSIVILGYSQGGSLAIMFARWLQETHGVSSVVFTLNSLQSFRPDFVEQYMRLGLRTRNFIYRNDPVSGYPIGDNWLRPGETFVIDGPRTGLANIDDHYLEHFFFLVDPSYQFHFPVPKPPAAVTSAHNGTD